MAMDTMISRVSQERINKHDQILTKEKKKKMPTIDNNFESHINVAQLTKHVVRLFTESKHSRQENGRVSNTIFSLFTKRPISI